MVLILDRLTKAKAITNINAASIKLNQKSVDNLNPNRITLQNLIIFNANCLSSNLSYPVTAINIDLPSILTLNSYQYSVSTKLHRI